MTDSGITPKRMRVAIRAYDLNRSLEFYRDQLGLSLITSWDRPDGAGHLLDAAGGVVELVGKSPGDAARGGWDFIMPVAKYEIIFEVANAQAAYDALKEKGLSPVGPPQQTAWGAISFTVLDPDETPIIYLQPKA